MDRQAISDMTIQTWLSRDAGKNNQRLIRTRWLAGILILVGTAISVYILDLPLNRWRLFSLGVAIWGYNYVLVVLSRRTSLTKNYQSLTCIQYIIMLQIILDWFSIGIFVHLTGGITSPGLMLFTIHVVLVAIMLSDQSPYYYVTLGMVVATGVTFLEGIDVLPHYVIIPSIDSDTHKNLIYISGQLMFLAAVLLVIAYLASSIVERLRERERQVTVLLHTTRDISSTLELSHVLQNLTRSAANALAVSGASIRLLNPTGKLLMMTSSYGLSKAYLEKGSVEVEQSPLDQQVLSGQGVIIDHATQDSRVQYPKQMEEEGINSILVVPIIGKQPLGVLRVYSHTPSYFVQRDIDFIQSLAYQSATAIENALIYNALQESEQERTKFIRQVTHELRAPVTGAQSLLQVLVNNMAGELTAQQHDILHRVENRMGTLLELITDLLALAASKSTRQIQELKPIVVQEIVSAVIDGYEHQAAQKQIQFDFNMPTKPLTVNATEEGLIQIFQNLMSNAIKYTLEGGQVKAEMTQHLQSVCIAISDTGIGIPEEALGKLGEEFYRADNVRYTGIPGTGLGISIVKQLVAAFGGLLRIESKLGVGTVFTVILPLDERG